MVVNMESPLLSCLLSWSCGHIFIVLLTLQMVIILLRNCVLSAKKLCLISTAYLAGCAGLANLPPAFVAALSPERWISTEHRVENNTQTPEITLFIVCRRFTHPQVDNLRRHVLVRSHLGERETYITWDTCL